MSPRSTSCSPRPISPVPYCCSCLFPPSPSENSCGLRVSICNSVQQKCSGWEAPSTLLATSQLSIFIPRVFTLAQDHVPDCSQDGYFHPDIYLGPYFSGHVPYEPLCSMWFRWKISIITDSFPFSPPTPPQLPVLSIQYPQPKQASKTILYFVLPFHYSDLVVMVNVLGKFGYCPDIWSNTNMDVDVRVFFR